MKNSRGTWLVVALVAASTLAACSEDLGSPDDVARQLAEGLSTRDLARVPFAGLGSAQADRRWRAATAGMGELAPTVRLDGVSDDGAGSATATLRYTWDLPDVDGDWTYETQAQLARRDGDWAVRWSPEMVALELQTGEALVIRQVPAQRGDIDGAGGQHLMTDRPVTMFGIDKTRVGPRRLATSARALADLLGIDSKNYVQSVRKAGDKAFVEAITLRQSDIPVTVATRYEDIRGATALSDEVPLGPTREFARPILGAVGPVTAEMIADSDGRFQVGDVAGLFGLQQRYDEQLSGSAGTEVRAENEATGKSRTLFEINPVAGKALLTTVDLDIQLLAENLLTDVRPASAVVAIQASTGDVLAAASGPGAGGYSTATLGQYAPGSTFKVVTALALLRAGLTQDTMVPCPATISVDGRSFKNYDDYPASRLGEISLRTALANSCNTAFIGQSSKVASSSLSDAAAALGLGVDHDLGFPAYLGSVPTDSTGTELAASTIGQGRVLASPLSMAAVAASIASGETVQPRLLVDATQPTVSPGQPLTTAEAETLREMMRAVVTEGSAGFLLSIPGDPVLAKTGTAEFGEQEPLQTHTWMIGVQGDLAVAVFFEIGESGSHTAGPILAEFLRGLEQLG